MEDTDDHRSRSSSKSLFESSRSAFRSQHSFNKGFSSVDDDHQALVRQAMEKAEKHPDRHRMAVVPTQSKKKINLVDVKKLTTSKKRLVLSRAMETSGQDNERLLKKIRERQDRYRLQRRGMLWQCMLTHLLYSAECLLFNNTPPPQHMNMQLCSSVHSLNRESTDIW